VRLLDVGCGHGFFLQAAAQQGYLPEGVDIDRDALEFAQAHFPFTLHERSIDTLEGLPHDYDTATMWQVLEHVKRPAQCARSVFNVIKPGGFFAGSVPNIGGIYARMKGRKWYLLVPPEHLNYFDVKTVRFLLQQAGFEPVFVGTIPIYAAPYFSWGLRSRIVNWAQLRSSDSVRKLCFAIQRTLTLTKRHLMYRVLNFAIIAFKLGGNSVFFIAAKPTTE